MKKVFIYADGACKGNPGAGGYGVVLKHNNNMKEIKGAESNTTNNKMELTAAIIGLRTLKEPCDVTLISDSNYLIQGMIKWVNLWMKKDWKTYGKMPVKNRELWEELVKLSKRHKIEWKWIKGHNGHVENEMADRLANKAIDELPTTDNLQLATYNI
ncbi:MAG: ribonuclease HI [Nitrospinae bacterium RIFCSPLOWO2_02_39_17]|nr:MAG: ribonuclease HI [Nitrospinae bacterium RIFCSPHIGHO2_02_39_11]OGW01085.1 MAG: ribonuclease HI [Nitrospinae bacterium RIFCSPHIGHO2_12_FULL_39_42]OGW01264.1 MAG: ribonuclease HI [Nitrospinae bacterium RIFCSPHIGHO2_02_FULL_39_82]OGW02021.1 MAG: ribonuclease HI [Nitrospinae bacterium RIFCSPLOWO2_02_39_17]OGW10431.1 MAG: ribonuclease HI [Nitrospinae bacterium RIFCSPLOWO2_12_FULL_39_93]OGW11152.1 MAG: ribonuclease HI [Nitrospinae bacterium RIFCSPLOWO2_12_39_15]